jgi:hypothetical protein
MRVRHLLACLPSLPALRQVRALADDLEQLRTARPGTSSLSNELRRQVQSLQVRGWQRAPINGEVRARSA